MGVQDCQSDELLKRIRVVVCEQDLGESERNVSIAGTGQRDGTGVLTSHRRMTSGKLNSRLKAMLCRRARISTSAHDFSDKLG